MWLISKENKEIIQRENERRNKIFFLVCFPLSVLLVLFLIEFVFFKNNKAFFIQDFSIEQNYEIFSAKDVLRISQISLNKDSIFSIDYKGLREKFLSQNDLLNDVKIVRIYPESLKFIFTFKEIIAFFQHKNYSYLLSSKGEILEKRPYLSLDISSLPVLIPDRSFLTKFRNFTVNNENLKEKFKLIANFLNIYRHNYEGGLPLNHSYFSSFIEIQTISFGEWDTIRLGIKRNPRFNILSRGVEVHIRLSAPELDLTKMSIMLDENIKTNQPKVIRSTINPTLSKAYLN